MSYALERDDLSAAMREEMARLMDK
jgi:hypothetical protein